MAKIDYHVFRKSKINSKGKKFYRWYYYFLDTGGKRMAFKRSGVQFPLAPDSKSLCYKDLTG